MTYQRVVAWAFTCSGEFPSIMKTPEMQRPSSLSTKDENMGYRINNAMSNIFLVMQGIPLARLIHAIAYFVGSWREMVQRALMKAATRS